MEEADVAISGAGVAGSTLAILLGRAGLSVRLYERTTSRARRPAPRA